MWIVPVMKMPCVYGVQLTDVDVDYEGWSKKDLLDKISPNAVFDEDGSFNMMVKVVKIWSKPKTVKSMIDIGGDEDNGVYGNVPVMRLHAVEAVYDIYGTKGGRSFLGVVGSFGMCEFALSDWVPMVAQLPPSFMLGTRGESGYIKTLPTLNVILNYAYGFKDHEHDEGCFDYDDHERERLVCGQALDVDHDVLNFEGRTVKDDMRHICIKPGRWIKVVVRREFVNAFLEHTDMGFFEWTF
jgi:hypothetical protein